MEAPPPGSPSVLPPLVEENGGLQKVSADGDCALSKTAAAACLSHSGQMSLIKAYDGMCAAIYLKI